MIDNIIKGIPALLGVFVGIFLFVFNISHPNYFRPFVIQIICLAIIAIVSLFVGKGLLGRHPRLGFVILELWNLLAIAVTSGTTFLILWIGTISPQWFSELNAENSKTVVGALGGAITTFFAVLWTKDIEEGKGFFWSSFHFKKAFGTSVANRKLTPERNTKEYEAIYDDRVSGSNEPIGWGFVARWRRAKIISKYLKDKARSRRTIAKKPATK
jgi:hypothetical protein